MELPAVSPAEVPAVLRRMFDAGRAFVVRAGTIILAAMILVWALLYFPHTDAREGIRPSASPKPRRPRRTASRAARN